ncbi:hypothetical protein [Geodermatophilus sp. SYSU D00684]
MGSTSACTAWSTAPRIALNAHCPNRPRAGSKVMTDRTSASAAAACTSSSWAGAIKGANRRTAWSTRQAFTRTASSFSTSTSRCARRQPPAPDDDPWITA